MSGPLPAQTPSRTQIIMLGTGTPIPDPERQGQAIAIVVDSVAYLFDAGSGVVRRAAAAGKAGVRAFAVRGGAQANPRFDRIFLTHLHSDHTLGLADAIFTPWIQGRVAPVNIYGPPGLERLISTILEGNTEDIAERVASAGGPSRDGWKAIHHEVQPGEVFKDFRITVRAFAVPHAGWGENAYGYRIDTPDRSIVISGDTRESDAVADACNGCDVMIHEVYSDSGFKTIPAGRQPYHAAAHTPATAVGRVASKGRAKMLILNHALFFGATEEVLLREVRTTFAGRVVLAKDLDIY